MPEIKKEVKIYKETYLCDSCGDGYMEHTGVVLDSNPSQYPHTCSKCGHYEIFVGRYFPCKKDVEIDSE